MHLTHEMGMEELRKMRYGPTTDSRCPDVLPCAKIEQQTRRGTYHIHNSLDSDLVGTIECWTLS